MTTSSSPRDVRTAARSDDDPLLRWRTEFPIVERTHYLISNSLGAMPRAARTSMEAFADSWDQRGVRAWAEGWWQLQDEVASDVEALLGVAAGTVSMHQNVTMASQAILSCFAFDGPRNRIVYTDLNFPSVMYLYDAQRARGAEVVRVPAADDGVSVDLDRLLAAIDERTLLVPISHVLFRSAFIQDAAAITARAREVGAFVILDVFQAVGTVPLRLADWGVHAAVGGALKFLCGGPGNCFLYVDPAEIPRRTPTFTGWAAHKRPFAFEREHDRRVDGGRFLNGTPNVPALFAGREGIRILRQVGIEAVRAKSMRQTALIVDRAQAAGLRVHTPLAPDSRGGTVAVHVDHGYEVCQALLAEDVVVDYRPESGIRIAPHFYTRDDECIAAVDRIVELRDSGEWQRFVGRDRRPG